jgi:hypothetical protein
MRHFTYSNSISSSLTRIACLGIVLGLLATPAVAQIGPGGQLTCYNVIASTPTLRGEGYTELTGDITLTCSGGVAPSLGSTIPTVNITVFYNSQVTSRLLPVPATLNSSEALLTIDEPGSGMIPAVPGFGPAAPLTLCASPTQGCLEYVSTVAGSSIPVATDTPQGTAATTPGANVFRGVVYANAVTFFGVPVLAPGNSRTRVFRITNVRLNANPFGGGSGSLAPVVASISISGNYSLLLADATPTVGFVTSSLTTSVAAAPSLSQCTTQTTTAAGILSFAETFATAFKTRVLAQNNVAYAGQNGTPGLNGFAAQNVPGSIYNSESNCVMPVAAEQTAGLSDFGTRLKATFNNIPAGVRLFVSVSNVLNNGLPVSIPGVVGGAAANSGTTGFAQLTNDETGAFNAVAATGTSSQSGVPLAELTVANGSASAVWEVINTNPNAIENLQFAVFTSYAANPALNSPSPGTITVNQSYAPTPPAFTAGSGAATSDTLPVPRFIPDSNSARDILTITLGSCSPHLSIAKAHSGNFTQGQTGAAFTLTVSNAPSAASTSGTVTVVDTLPAGLTATAMSGNGWSCNPTTLTCTITDVLAGGSSYSPITLTVNVASNASSPQVNQANVSGGGSVPASTSDAAIVTGSLAAVSVTPSSGSGLTQTFSLWYSDSSGVPALSTVAAWFVAAGGNSTNSCLVSYDRAANSLSLLNDAGTQWNHGTPGDAGILQNSACFVTLANSSIALSANTLMLVLAVTFDITYAGTKTVYLSASDTAGNSTGYQSRGTWTVPAVTATATADSVTPSGGTVAHQKFTLQYTDTARATSLATARVLFNSALAPNSANSCEFYYDRASSTAHLLNDAGTQWLSGTLGTGSLENAQCSIDLGFSNAVLLGNTLTLNLVMGFKPAFAGAKNIYMSGSDVGGNASGWQTRGLWNVPSDLSGPSVMNIVCPSQATSGSAVSCSVNLWLNNPGTTSLDSLAFTVTVTPVGGAPALTTGQLGFSSYGSTTNTANSVTVTLPAAQLFNGLLGNLAFILPAAASPGQSYSVAITSVAASQNGTPFNIAIGLPAIISIPVPGQPTCSTNVTVTPNARGEGYSEQVGDITLTCTGGTAPAVGTAIPQADITVQFNAPITSRLLPVAGVSNTVSEVLLMIDEPGSGLPPTVSGFGPAAPQNLCATPLQGCVEYVSSKSGVAVATDTPQGTAATSPGKNVFQGIVNGSSVTFHGVPVLAPGASSAVSGVDWGRVFRITNVRVNANPLSGGSASGASPVQASISTSGAATLSLTYSMPTVAFVTSGLSTSASAASTVNQCNSQTLAPATTLSFGENFGTAFKTRVAAQTNTPYAGQTPQSGYFAQNIPGGIYNSESSFVVPVAANQTTGLADYGTRLRAQFNNIPSGVHLFVSVSNVLNSGLPVPVPAVIGGSAANSGSNGFAQLTATETGGFSAVAATAYANSGSVPVAEIPVVNGSATAVWEVINTNPATSENLKFAVFTSFTANPGQNSPPPGTATVNLSYASAPPSFTSANGAAASDTLPTPRFIGDIYAARNVLTIAAGGCPGLGTSITDSGNFVAGRTGATFNLTVSNAPTSNTSAGTVTVASTLSSGLTATGIEGVGWSCNLGSLTCTRGEPLAAGSSYPSITVTVNVGAVAGSQSIVATISGGNSATATSTHEVYIPITSADMTSPVPGSTLASSSVLFSWNSAPSADQYWLDVGNSVGSGDLWRGSLTSLSQLVTGLPCDGRTLYVQLYTHVGNVWGPAQRYTYTAPSVCLATLISPAPGTALSATTATFTWTVTAGADQYWLDVGSALGTGDIFAGATASTTKAVSGVPCDGRTLYVQLYTHINDAWASPRRYTYTAPSGCYSILTTPTPGTVLPSSSVTFNWSAANGADQYWLDIGSTIGGSDLWRGALTTTSQLVSGLPCDGRTINAQLFTHTNGAWSIPQRYTYTAPTGCFAILISPTPGTVLSNTTVTFGWNAVAAADQYWLDIGSTVGASDLWRGALTATSQLVAGLPCDGRTINAQLFTHINGAWSSPQRYAYTAPTGCFAFLISPTPNTTLTSTTVTFGWSPATGADQYWLDVGSSLGTGDVWRGALTGTSQLVNGIPCDGRTLYAQLYAHRNGAWLSPLRYTYNAPTACYAAITSPTPGTTLPSTTVAFTWSAANGADQYWLDVGTALGIGNIWRGALAGASQIATGLPCNGSTVYVQLYTHLSGAWLAPQRYTYTAVTGCGSTANSDR